MFIFKLDGYTKTTPNTIIFANTKSHPCIGISENAPFQDDLKTCTSCTTAAICMHAAYGTGWQYCFCKFVTIAPLKIMLCIHTNPVSPSLQAIIHIRRIQGTRSDAERKLIIPDRASRRLQKPDVLANAIRTTIPVTHSTYQ